MDDHSIFIIQGHVAYQEMADPADPPTEILIALNNFNPLGIQRVIITLMNNWPDDDTNISISVHKSQGEFKNDIEVDVPIYELDKIAPPVQKLTPFYRVLGYHRILNKLNPDVVLTSNQFESLALCMAKRFHKNISLVIPEHNHVSSEIQHSSSVEGWFGQYYRLFFSREYQKYADVVLAISEGVAEDLIKSHGIPRDNVETIYNPVDIKKIRRLGKEPVDSSWLEPENNTVISVSRHVPQKGLDILIRSWKQVIDRSEHDVVPAPKLIITSYGPETASLKSLVNELELNESVQFTGFVDNVWAMVEKSNLFICPSRWEGFGLSIVESQALGTPVIVSDCPGGPSEIVLNGEAGFLFKNENIIDCADTIIKALTNNELCQSKVSVANDYLSRFRATKISKQYAELLKNSND